MNKDEKNTIGVLMLTCFGIIFYLLLGEDGFNSVMDWLYK